MIVVAAVLLTASTYAWMTIASQLMVTDLSLTVVSSNGLEIALDDEGAPGEWSSSLDLSTLMEAGVALTPATYSALEDAFQEPEYGTDGRIATMVALLPTYLQDILFGEDSSMAEEDTLATVGVLAIDVWVRTSSEDCSVQLSAPTQVEEGLLGSGTYVVGTPVWNAQTVSHDDGGTGAQNAIRIGFRPYDENGETEQIVIYEPNTDGTTTLSVDDTGEGLVAEEYLVTQAPSTWAEQDPVLNGSVDYTLGELEADVELFALATGEAKKVTIYIWLEGQDADCTNTISNAELLMNLQITAVTEGADASIVAR